MLTFTIDTRPGARNPFSPPATIEDYADWFADLYERSIERVGCEEQPFGVRQWTNQMHHAARHGGVRVYVFGPHARAAASALKAIVDHEACLLEVIGEGK